LDPEKIAVRFYQVGLAADDYRKSEHTGWAAASQTRGRN